MHETEAHWPLNHESEPALGLSRACGAIILWAAVISQLRVAH